MCTGKEASLRVVILGREKETSPMIEVGSARFHTAEEALTDFQSHGGFRLKVGVTINFRCEAGVTKALCVPRMVTNKERGRYLLRKV